MKREFLQNLKVGEEALPKEVIDAIMEENGRDIEAAKVSAVKPYADYDAIKEVNNFYTSEEFGKRSSKWGRRPGFASQSKQWRLT